MGLLSSSPSWGLVAIKSHQVNTGAIPVGRPLFLTGAIMANDLEKIREALSIIDSYGGIGGEHHKTWVIDQVVRTLCGTEEVYKKWVQDYTVDGAYEWDEGIAP